MEVQSTSFSLPDPLFKRMDARALSLGLSRIAYVRRLLELELIEWDE